MNIKIPEKFLDTDELLSERMKNYFFANSILTILNSFDFTRDTIERKCKKGFAKGDPKSDSLTSKQVNLIAWIYVLNREGLNTYDTKSICAFIEEAQGIQFISNPHDLSVWFTDIGGKLTRDKVNKKTKLKSILQSTLDSAFDTGVFDLKVICDVRK